MESYSSNFLPLNLLAVQWISLHNFYKNQSFKFQRKNSSKSACHEEPITPVRTSINTTIIPSSSAYSDHKGAFELKRHFSDQDTKSALDLRQVLKSGFPRNPHTLQLNLIVSSVCRIRDKVDTHQVFLFPNRKRERADTHTLYGSEERLLARRCSLARSGQKENKLGNPLWAVAVAPRRRLEVVFPRDLLRVALTVCTWDIQ